jgi:CHAD domain-containing protein
MPTARARSRAPGPGRPIGQRGAPGRPRGPYLEAEIHQLHRKLRAELFRRRLTRAPRKDRQPIREILHALGEVRDLDVSARALDSWVSGAKRKQTGAGVRTALRRLRRERRARRAHLQVLLRDHARMLDSDPIEPARAALGPSILVAARQAGLRRLRRAHRRALSHPSSRRLHRVRKRIRELGLLREVEESARPIGRPRHDPELAQLMRRLGQLNDRTVLIRWLDREGRRWGIARFLRDLRAEQRKDRADLLDRLDRIGKSDWAQWTKPAAQRGA